MTIKELINILKEFPEDMEVVDSSYCDIESVHKKTWTHTYYTDKPDKQVAVIKHKEFNEELDEEDFYYENIW